MKRFYCIESYSDEFFAGKEYEYFDTTLVLGNGDFLCEYRVMTELGQFTIITNTEFIKYHFMKIREYRKQKLERINSYEV